MQLLLFCPRCIGDDLSSWNVLKACKIAQEREWIYTGIFWNTLFDHEMGQQSGLSDES